MLDGLLSVETVFNSYYSRLHDEVSQWLAVTIDWHSNFP